MSGVEVAIKYDDVVTPFLDEEVDPDATRVGDKVAGVGS